MATHLQPRQPLVRGHLELVHELRHVQSHSQRDRDDLREEEHEAHIVEERLHQAREALREPIRELACGVLPAAVPPSLRALPIPPRRCRGLPKRDQTCPNGTSIRGQTEAIRGHQRSSVVITCPNGTATMSRADRLTSTKRSLVMKFTCRSRVAILLGGAPATFIDERVSRPVWTTTP